jgi:hypothetical protein
MKIEGKFEIKQAELDGVKYEYETTEIYVDGVRIDPDDHREAQHASSQFQWGYGGSGPAFLAWVLLYIATADKDTADQFHQTLKWQLVATWEFNKPFEDAIDIDQWLALQERQVEQ